MDFEIPADIAAFPVGVNPSIEGKVKPLVEQDDNIRDFDPRLKEARTDWERAGRPRRVSVSPAAPNEGIDYRGGRFQPPLCR